ncbi:MAG: DUF4340 domain-containing protein [Gemmataceae bacterium]
MPTDPNQPDAPRADHRSHAPMNFRFPAILFGIVAVVGLLLLWQSFTEPEDPTKSGDLILKTLAGEKADAVAEVEVEKPDGSKVVLRRAGKDDWTVEAPSVKARADKAAVEGVVTAVLGLRAVHYGELRDNPAIHGLDKPLKVTLRTGDGKSETVSVGDVTVGGSKAVAFVSTADRPRPMAVAKASVDALLKDAKGVGHSAEMAKWTADYRTKAVFAADTRASGDDVTALKLTRGGKELALTRNKNGTWEFAAPAGWGDAAAAPDTAAAPGTLTGVRPILAGLTGLAAGAADDFLDAPADLAQYGLNPGNPERVRVELKLRDGKTEVAFIGKKADDKKDEKKDAFAPAGGKLYVQLEGTPGVVRAAAVGLDGLAAVIDNPTPLRDRDLLRDDVKTRIDAVDVITSGQTVQLRKSGADWKLAGGPNDPQAANQTTAKALLDLVSQARLVKEFPPTTDAAFAAPAAEVKLYADALEATADPKAAPKLKAGVVPTVLVFGKKDAAGVWVRRTRPDGSKTDFVVPDKVKVGAAPTETDVLAAVTKTRFDYLDPTLPGFSQFQATKLTISDGATVKNEVEKEKTTGVAEPAWKYLKPEPMKGQTADAGSVGDLLNLLSTQQAGRFVRELGDADKGKEKDIYLGYGLAAEAPRLKVVVGLDAPAPGNERVYYLGNETDDKQNVFARVEGRPVVFTVPKGIVADRLAGADLRDRTLVRFDASKLNRVQVRGWKDVTGGEMLVREFRKEGGNWVAKQPPGFSLDPPKVDDLVRAVQQLRVKDFREGGEHPDHRVNPEANGFEVTLEFDGAPTLVVSIGAEVEGGAARIARVITAGMPPRTQIVTVLPDALKSFRESAKSFAR